MAQISNCYLEYHSEFITLITLWRPQDVCSICVMLQVNIKMESMLPRIKAVLEVKVQNSTRKEYLSECMLSCSCRITFFLSIREQICNVLAEFFSVKRTSRPQRICSCASQLFTDVLLFLGNGTIFREKNIQRYFYAVSWLQDM